MPADLLSQLPSFGICGLLFVMWWLERQERARAAGNLRDAMQYAAQIADLNRNLLDVIRANTDALAVLREELRSQRDAQRECLGRLLAQMEELECG